ncbi:hypothetical protein JG687_00010727 [Phytophthora cactorum]|uniref:WRKY19-like zinc finger domain-containing protein n=1 Tax=Phytophthora cactorum TaxID=29920 RepID=A0A8T1HN86_9STRA|nr:hypothetical protein Pcac1_g13449 [Phytophthora cactorum]KAG2889024.1 hypothetical protein PC114_g18131 [Phytophthora cactorum]KAG2915424.1 hypothetical protein PC117_g18011 [Phytophthora cactorum]KAG2998309.1 hypothetical protein PC119_g17474 [Phytophthora cactorum]KAG3008082.1 hypothetical protein PC120_g16474 [Phytophthora cactorum]
MAPLTSARPCSAIGCNKRAQTRRLCKAHGGGVRCRISDCKKLAQTRGMCVAHGGGRRCSYEGCMKLGQYTGFCLSHGGGRRCNVLNCQKLVQLRGYCKRHGKQFLEPSTAGKKADAIMTSKTVKSKFSLDFLLSPSTPIDDGEKSASMISSTLVLSN